MMSATEDAILRSHDRYSRQVLFQSIGVEGQRRLAQARVLLIGCGALGSVLAETLVRAGVGFLRICDRDFIELNNLQRQVLFDEEDIAQNLPKAQAAAAKLRRINSEVTVEPVVADVTHANIEMLADGMHLLMDGTDNFETRYLINDLAVRTRRSWVYGAAIGSTGLCMAILPFDTPCLRCLFEEAPPPQLNPTCDTAGVLAMTVNIVASFQAVEAIKMLTGQHGEVNRHLMHIDAWSGRVVNLNVQSAYVPNRCTCCGQREFEFLDGRRTHASTQLCGRNAVQVTAPADRPIDFTAIATKLTPITKVPPLVNEFLLRVFVDDCELTLFSDGRAIIKGTDNPDRARALYAKYIGA